MRLVDVLFWYAKALFYVVRYPAYSDDYMKQEIESQAPQIPQDELDRYKEFGANSRHFMFEVMVFYALVFMKNLYFIYYTITNVNFVNPEENIKPLGAGGGFKYTCLASNCTKYIEAANNTTISFASELKKLPAFAICKQDWKWFFNPALGAQKIALILYSDSTFFFTFISIITPICIYANIIRPTSNVAILFSICPRAELGRIRRKIGVILEKLSFSLDNFIMNKACERYNLTTRRLRRISHHPLRNMSSMLGRFGSDYSGNEKIAEMGRNSRLKTTTEDDERDVGELFSEYLPINRTQWWRQKWSRSVVSFSPTVIVYMFLGYIMIQSGVAYYAQFVAIGEQSDFLDSLRSANCSLWFNHSDTIDGASSQNREIREILDSEHLKVQWNWFSVGELILTSIVPIFISYATLCDYYFACLDIKVCIVELRILLAIAIDYIDLNCAESIELAHYNGRKFSCLEQMRQTRSANLGDSQIDGSRNKSTARVRFKSTTSTEMSWLSPIIFDRLTKMINFDWPTLLITTVDRFGKSVRGKLEARLVNQEFVLDLIKLASTDHKRTDLLVKLLGKIHVNYWTLVDLLDEHNLGLKIVLLTSCLSNYGFTLIGVYLNRNIDNFRQGPLLYLSIQWTVVTFLISIASSIHADLQQLDHVFWSIVACTTNCQDIRVQHFRRIWEKNLIAMGADGGLAIKIWNISITYVKILQLTFGTATIFALALNRY